MKRFFWAAVAASVVVGAAPSVGSAQFGGGPGIPAVPQPAVPGAPAAGAGAGLGAAGPRVGFFQRMKTGMGDCIQKLLGSPLGQLLNNATKPLSALTGGVIPTLEGKPSVEDTKKPGVAGAAAQGKKDAAEVAERRAAVKYLGTLDCRYYPEASKALSDALRTDPSECVRYEAAVALTRGCCCNQTTIKALTAAVSGYEEDGNPGERSARVRCTAAVALEKCLACYVQNGSPDDLKPEEDCPPKKKEPPKPMGEQPKGGEQPKDGGDAKPDGGKSSGAFAPPTRKQYERAKEVLTAFVDTYSTTEALYGARAATGSRATPGILEASATQAKAATPMLTPASHTAMAVRTPAPAPVLPARTSEPTVVAKAPAPAPTLSRAKFKPDAEAEPTPMPVVPGPVVPAADTRPAEPTAPAATAETTDAKAVEQLVHKVLLSEAAADQHAAIRQLVKHEWTAHPMVASCLVAGAKSPADAAVRVDCIRHLAHHGMNHKDVLTALADLCSDPDTWVREEAMKACETLKK